MVYNWKAKFNDKQVTYDEILAYANDQWLLQNISNKLHCTSLEYSSEVDEVKNEFFQQFEMLNVCLIKYVSERPDLNWCTLPALFDEFGFTLPRSLQKMIEEFIEFPGKVTSSKFNKYSRCENNNTFKCFKPGSNVSLKLSGNITLHQLTKLVSDLIEVEKEMLNNVGMLVFFSLSRSRMFNQYMWSQIQHAQVQYQHHKLRFQSTTGFPSPKLVLSLQSHVKHEDDECAPLPMSVLIESLQYSKVVVENLLSGEAKYHDIIANGALDLESLDIDKECSILTKYAQRNNLTWSGLHGVRNMLELFQYSKFIQNIHNVCRQYDIKGCLSDTELYELKAIADKLESEDDRRKLTPNVASKCLVTVKKLLCISADTDMKCLDIFTAIQESTAFYAFVKRKEFYDEKGVANFNQKFQLITAQLQHEEYDEQVLNHLYAAFKLILPFMDIDQNLKTLMAKVLALDVKNGLKQLETVNVNITLITLWFSRAEVGLI